jgi:hypothetical protein
VKLTLARFGRDVAGTPFRSFLAHHLKAYRREELEAVLRDVRPGLPSTLDDRVDGWAIRLAGEVEQRTVWAQDTSALLQRLVWAGRKRAREEGLSVGDAEMLDLFEAVVLETALLVDDRPELRDHLLAADRGWLARYKWGVLSGLAGAALLLWQPTPPLEAVGWALVGLAVLPPLAGWVKQRAEA